MSSWNSLKDHPAQQAVLGDAVLKDIIESDGGHLERWVMLEVAEAYVQCSKHIPPMQRIDHDIKWGERITTVKAATISEQRTARSDTLPSVASGTSGNVRGHRDGAGCGDCAS